MILYSDYDYIMDDEGKIFIVLGYHHHQNRIRARLVYIPDASGHKGYTQVVYSPLTDNSLIKNYEHIETDFLVPVSRIAMLYQPRAVLDSRLNDFPKGVTEFLARLSEDINIPLSQFGIFGSWLVGLEKPGSDIDIVIFGKTAATSYQYALRRFSDKWGITRIEPDEILTKAARFADSLGIQPQDVVKILSLRRTKFVVQSIPVSISFSYMNAAESQSRTIGRPMRQVKLKGIVTDASLSCFTPRIYEVIIGERSYTVITYLYLYKEVAGAGDAVLIYGTLRTNAIITVGQPGEYILPE